MSTPEKRVKDKVKAMLKEKGAYFFMPATAGFGKSGVPDIVASVDGYFWGIECKAQPNKPTALQTKNLEQIAETGGVAIAVDETGLGAFKMLLDTGSFNLKYLKKGEVLCMLKGEDK
jgi:hypothetical protein